MRIRSRLLLLVSTVLLPAIVGTAIALAYIYKEEQDFNYASIRQTANALALAIDQEMGRPEAILRTLANAQSVRREELERFYHHAMEVAQDTETHIILSRLDGTQLVNTRLPFGDKLPKTLAIEQEFRAAHGNDATWFTPLYVAPISIGYYNFAVSIPVWRDGKVVLRLALIGRSRQMQKFLADQRLPSTWLPTLLDSPPLILPP